MLSRLVLSHPGHYSSEIDASLQVSCCKGRPKLVSQNSSGFNLAFPGVALESVLAII